MKYALLIGINYSSHSTGQLNGCINDVINIRQMLIRNFGYRNRDIKMLTDDTYHKPTTQNILHEISILIQKSKQCSDIFFHYSGHGSYIIDQNNDESDKRDECLIPLDYEKNGSITDDMIYNLFIKNLSPNCHATILIDACHSGSCFDLSCMYNQDINNWEKINDNNIENKNIIMISGCKDEETSSDAYLQGAYNGALTNGITNTLTKYNYKISWKQLIDELNEFLKSNKFLQKPQLSSSNTFDLNTFITL
jgi:hypothetical protein